MIVSKIKLMLICSAIIGVIYAINAANIYKLDSGDKWPRWIKTQGKWKIEDNCLSSIGRSPMLILNPIAKGDFSLQFYVRMLKINPAGGHFGINLADAASKGTETRFYCPGKIVMTWDARNGKREGHGLFGKLTKPLEINENSPWTRFKVNRHGDKLELWVGDQLVGEKNKIPPENISVQIYTYNLDVQLKMMSFSLLDANGGKEPEFVDPPYIPPPKQKIIQSAPNAYRILFVGNSITRHGRAPERLKWNHISGMAASCEKNDYAHVFAAAVQKSMPKRKVEISFADVNKLRIHKGNNPLPPGLQVPHLVIIQTGEHEGPKQAISETERIYSDYIVSPFLKLKPQPRIICVGLWYPTNNQAYSGWVKGIDDAYRKVCSRSNISYVSVESIARNPKCRGWGEHPGVRWHPNDKGMRGYADLLLKAFEQKISAKKKTSARRTPLIIREGFDTKKKSSEYFSINPKYWKIDNGKLKSIDGLKRMLFLGIGKNDWRNYEVEVKLRRVKIDPKGQHFGIVVRSDNVELSKSKSSLRFYSSGPGVSLLEEVDGRRVRHCGLGDFTAALPPAGEKAKWSTVRIEVKGNSAKFFLDNKLQATANDIVSTAGWIAFYVYHVDVEIDDFKVIVTGFSGEDEVTADAGPVRNLLNNSSFELTTLDKLPDFWGCEHFGIVDPRYVVEYKRWLDYYGVDDTESFDGAKSMRIHNPDPGEPSDALCVKSVCLGTTKNIKYSFSAYMKASRNGMKARLHKREVTLTTDWKRYNCEFINSGHSLYDDVVKIKPLEQGTIWIDALQLEAGEKVSAYQASRIGSALQIQEGNPDKPLDAVPDFSPLKIDDRDVRLDGRLTEAVWKNAEKLELKNVNGAKASERGLAMVYYSKRGIYIGVKCYEAGAKDNICTVTKHDGAIWNDPSIELFVDPELSRNYYYHLGINQKGVRFDAQDGDVSWNADWKALTYTDSSGKYWSAEIFLPFGEFGISRAVGEWWGINICRSNIRKQEYNSWSPTYGGFHAPTRFGKIKIPPAITGTFRFDCQKIELNSAGDNRVAMTATIVNHSSAARKCLLKAKVYDENKREVAALSKETELSVDSAQSILLGEFAGGSGKGKYSVDLRILDKRQQSLFCRKLSVSTERLLTVMTHYDLYTGENNLSVRVNCNLASAALNSSSISLSCGDQLMKVDKLQKSMDIELPIMELSNGPHELNVMLKDNNGRLLARDSSHFRKAPAAKNVVRNNRLARIVEINGRAFIPLGFAWEGKITDAVMAYLADNGVNSITFYAHGRLEETAKVLELGKKYGVYIRVGGFSRNYSKSAAFIKKFKDYPALLGWDIFDEQFTGSWGKQNYKFIAEQCRKLKDIDPYHPVFINENQYGMNFLRGRNLVFPGDLLSLDYYAWTPSGNIPVTSKYVRDLMHIGDNDGRPGWMFLFAAGYAFWSSRDYTPAEQEFSTYASIINGATGIYYWASHPKSNSQWKQIKKLFKELKELTPVLASIDTPPVVVPSNPAIEFLVKRYENCIYIVAVNNKREPVDVRFEISTPAVQEGQAKVLFENRRININRGVIADSFDGFSRHIYKMDTVKK